jgi:hypothetical protein
MEIFPDTMPMRATHDARSCPRCGAAPLAHVADCETVHWLCRSCDHCWQEKSGRLRGVDPITCPGCSTKPRPECIALFARGFPRFSG